MNGNQSWKKTEEAGIDLAQLLCRICRKWKYAVALGIASAALACCLLYVKNGQKVLEKDFSDIQEIELTQEEQQAVDDTALAAEEMQKLEEYLENSVLMQADPYHKHSVVSLYSIDNTAGRNLLKITEGYLTFLTNGGVTEAIKEADNRRWNMDSSYLQEIIRAWQRTDDTYRITNGTEGDMPKETLLYVEVTGKNAKQAEQLSESIQEALEEYHAVLKKECGKHTLTLVSSMHKITADSSLQTLQRDKRESLKGYRSSLKAALDGFSEEQKLAYGLTEEEPEKDELQESNWFRGKYVLLAFAGGIFLHCVICTCLYLLSGTVNSASEFRLNYNIPFYGSISMTEKLDKNRRQRTEYVLNRLRLSCRNQGIQRVCLTASTVLDETEKKCLNEIAQGLKESGIETLQAEDVNRDMSQWDRIAEQGHVLMICRTGKTAHRNIDEEMEFYQHNGIEVMGAVLFEDAGCNSWSLKRKG
ncbi:MAG: hypothetical protein HFH32_03170 [Eubacterium sp.]|jgi:ribosomal protein L44E|nr:hypothetical protein [Eubacterium sp.]